MGVLLALQPPITELFSGSLVLYTGALGANYRLMTHDPVGDLLKNQRSWK